MTTARDIVTGALTFGLNRLSPGEAIDADLGAVCLTALNHVVDQMGGAGGMLFAETLTESPALTAAVATIPAHFAVAPGVHMRSATVKLAGATLEYPIAIIPLEEYQAIGIKTIRGIPDRIAYDGLSTVYVYPVPNGDRITIRTGTPVADFADLDTDYLMPSGYKSAFSALVAEVLAPTLIGGVTPAIRASADAARMRLSARSISPAIIGGPSNPGRLASFLRGY